MVHHLLKKTVIVVRPALRFKDSALTFIGIEFAGGAAIDLPTSRKANNIRIEEISIMMIAPDIKGKITSNVKARRELKRRGFWGLKLPVQTNLY